MQISRSLPRNPYAAFDLMTRRGAMGEDRGPLERRPGAGVRHAAPILQNQLFTRLHHYESLGGQIGSLRSALAALAPPAASGAPALQASAKSAPPHFRTSLSASVPPAGPPPSRVLPPEDGESVLLPAELLASHAIFLTPGESGSEGRPSGAARLETDAVQLNPNAISTATLVGGRIQLNNQGDKTDFGTVTINGVAIQIGSFKGTSVEAAAEFIVDRINRHLDSPVEASVSAKHRDRIVLTSKTSGSAGNFTIEKVVRDTSSKGSFGFAVGLSATGRDESPKGKDGLTDLGSVTINGKTTEFGVQRFASAQAAAQYMAERLSLDHAGKLDVSVGGDALDRLVLTSRTVGSAARIAVENVTPGSDKKEENDGKSGFKAGVVAIGSDSEPGTPGNPGITDFGQITLNGITTVFGVLDNRSYTAQTAALYLAQRINETNGTLRASVQDGRLKLTSVETGPGAGIRVEAIASDTDGDPDNDRAVGFLLGATASGQATTRPRGPESGSGPTTGTGTGSVTGPAPGDAEQAEKKAASPAESQTSEAPPEYLEFFRDWTEKTNAYLNSLDRRTQEHPRGELKAFRLTIGAMLGQERALSDVGLSVENGMLRLDEAAFRQALEARPEAALGALQTFRETLDPLLAAQGHALDFMRGVGEAVRARIPEISQAQAMRFKLEARGKEIGLWLSSLEKLAPTLSEQTEKLRELGRSDQDESESKKGLWPPEDKEKPRTAKEVASEGETLPRGGIPAHRPVIPAHRPVIPAHRPVIPAEAGIQWSPFPRG